MFRVVNGQKIGVLTDFDLASDESVVSKDDVATPVNMFRTGTQPFMALDLIEPGKAAPRHLARHDLESFLYVLVWQTSRYDDKGNLIKDAPLNEWEQLPYDALYNLKFTTLLGGGQKFPNATPNFAAFDVTILDLATAFSKAQVAAGDHATAEARAAMMKVRPNTSMDSQVRTESGTSKQVGTSDKMAPSGVTRRVRERASKDVKVKTEPGTSPDEVSEVFDTATQGGRITHKMFLSHLESLLDTLEHNACA